MAKLPTKSGVKRATIRDMKKLGTYKPEFDRVVDIYAGMVEQYYLLDEKFKQSGYQCEIVTETGGVKKAPIVTALESLRKDILAYADRLRLNPKAFESFTVEDSKRSLLADALRDLDG